MENLDYKDCPPGRHSWSSYTRYVVSGTIYHQPIKNPLPLAVFSKIQQLFDRLGGKEFLAGLRKFGTKRTNKFFTGD